MPIEHDLIIFDCQNVDTTICAEMSTMFSGDLNTSTLRTNVGLHKYHCYVFDL